MILKIQRVDDSIDVPAYMKDSDAGLDLPSYEECTLKPNEKRKVRTGLKFAIPLGYAGFVWDRSGIAAKHNVHTLAGVIDSGYRGEISVVLANLSERDFHIDKGMRIAQMVIKPVVNCDIVEVDDIGEDTERNGDGFGSTGE